MYLNLAAYLFTDLDDLPALREEIREAGSASSMRGTVLLAPEGHQHLRLRVAGARRAMFAGGT